MATWKHTVVPDAGFTFSLSDALSVLDQTHPSILRPVDDGVMVIGSDYSGQHKGAVYEAHSFVVTTIPALMVWEASRREFRQHWLKDGRRMSFKQLGDSVRWRALQPFLDSAFTLRGNLISVLVNRQITTFIEGGATLLLEAMPEWFPPETSPLTAEKMYVLSSFVAMITAGLRDQEQPSVWLTDHDETVDTNAKRACFATMLSHLIFGATRWHNPATVSFGTTGLPNAPTWSEDFTAIPDLMAGAFCKLGNLLPTYEGSESWIKSVSSSDVQDRRAKAVVEQLQKGQGNMPHILLRLEPDEERNVRASAQCFMGTCPAPPENSP